MPRSPLHPLSRAGWSDRVEALYSSVAHQHQHLVPARVVGVERGTCRVATPDGERSLRSVGLAVGDWIALDGDVVHQTLPQWSTLERLDSSGNTQVLAANLDVVLIAAPADRLSPARVERELVVAWDSGARPVVVITKLDVAPRGTVSALVDRLTTVDVIETSAVTGRGLEELRTLLVEPVTAALLGPSGAGKSTLVNALLDEDRLAVGTVRDVDHRGRHTTTSRVLVPLPSGGSLIDMPGLRSLGTDASGAAVGAAFPDIDELARECRFADCAHHVEPGCAVTAAVEGGQLEPARFASYRKLLRETAFEHRRSDRLAAKKATRTWKVITKAQRKISKNRER